MSRSMVLSSFVAGGTAAPRRPESIGTGFRQALCKLGFPYTTASMKSLIWEIGGERTSEIITMAWSSNSAMENEGTRRDDALVRYIAKYIRKQSDESGGVHGREQNGHGTVKENGDGTIID